MMRKTSLHIFVITLLSALFGSCEWNVDMEDLKKPPRLVLNSIVRVGEPVTVRLSRTWFFTEENPNIAIPDAEVSLHVNGQYVETMTWTEDDKESKSNGQGYYQAAYTPKAGDRVALTAAREGYATVSGEIAMPAYFPAFEATERITEPINESPDDTEDYYGERLLSVTFRDNPDEKNYYMFFCEIEQRTFNYEEGIYGEYEWVPLNAAYEKEPLFTGQKNALEEILGYDRVSGLYGRVFSDDQINGKEYTLRLSSNNAAFYIDVTYGDDYVEGPYGYPEPVVIGTEKTPIRHYRVSLHTISESYYRYMKTLIEMEDTSLRGDLTMLGLAEPISIFSNIHNGLGILGACNGQSVTLELSTDPPAK